MAKVKEKHTYILELDSDEITLLRYIAGNMVNLSHKWEMVNRGLFQTLYHMNEKTYDCKAFSVPDEIDNVLESIRKDF